MAKENNLTLHKVNGSKGTPQKYGVLWFLQVGDVVHPGVMFRVTPRSIPKEFMLSPLGHPDKSEGLSFFATYANWCIKFGRLVNKLLVDIKVFIVYKMGFIRKEMPKKRLQEVQ